jgi:16S rRNA processing protein RimM
MSEPTVIGSFGKSFGIRGWIKVNSLTNPQANILNFKPWLIRKNDSWEEIYFEDSRQHADNIIVKLPNCNSPEEARNNFTNIKIGVWRKQLPKLPTNEYYWAELIGMQVMNSSGVDFGVVQELTATGANDVLVVAGDRKRLIPYTSNVILKVDLAKKIIQVDWEQDFL